MDRKQLIVLMFIILIASAIRFHDPTFRSIWGDEAHSIYRAIEYSQSGIQAATANILKDSHLPAYFLLLSVWMKGFGIGEYSLRALSVLIGILAVISFYFFAKQLFEEKTALIGSFLMAISPLAIMHSQELRMYGLLLLFSILSSSYLWKLLSGNKNHSALLGYVLFTILLMLTHIYAVLILVAQFLVLAIDYWQERNLSRGLIILLSQIFIGIIAFPFYIKIILMGLSSVITGAGEMAFSVFPSYIKPFLFFFVLTLGETVAPWNVPVVLPAILVFGYLFLRNFKWLSDKKTVFLLILCLFPVLFAAFFLRPTMPKFLITVLPFYILLIGRSLTLLEPGSLRYGLIIVITALQLCSVYNYFNLKEYHNSNQIEPWRKVSAIIMKDYRKGDIIITSYRYIIYQILNYYMYMLAGGDHPLYSVQDSRYAVFSGPGKIIVFGKSDVLKNIVGMDDQRVWFITHISDDRALPAGYDQKVRTQLGKSYRLVSDKIFIPYEETIVSKLPIKRHKTGSARISLSLYRHK